MVQVSLRFPPQRAILSLARPRRVAEGSLISHPPSTIFPYPLCQTTITSYRTTDIAPRYRSQAKIRPTIPVIQQKPPHRARSPTPSLNAVMLSSSKHLSRCPCLHRAIRAVVSARLRTAVCLRCSRASVRRVRPVPLNAPRIHPEPVEKGPHRPFTLPVVSLPAVELVEPVEPSNACPELVEWVEGLVLQLCEGPTRRQTEATQR